MPDFNSILRIEFADFLLVRESVLSESAYAQTLKRPAMLSRM
ncbi:hypothetical protein J2Y67_003513 [Neobacillus niacini]|nr:hypothetical protein [Neobacillus niacini]